MRADRKALAHHPRGLLYNDDGDSELPYKTPEELIAHRVRQVVDTQVTSIFYCTGGGGLFWGHQPKVGEALGKFIVPAHDPGIATTMRGLEALKALGTDPLEVVTKFGHEHHMEVFWSYRMNNPEDSFVDWGFAQWKRDHPQFLMGKKQDFDTNHETDPKVWWSLEDFAHPEVRDYIVQIFEDVCSRYDVDGIELDFIRHPLFFRPNLDGKPATPEQVDMMTDMVRKIRAMTERIGLKRGRPLLVEIHAPVTVKGGLDIGLDVPTYLKEGLMDMLVAGQDYVQMGVAAELKTMVDLGHQYDVPVYSLIAPPKPYALYADSRAWRGAAMDRWYWGADGIYTFNLFPTSPDRKFIELGSPSTLKGLDKIYGIDNPATEDTLGTFKLAAASPNRLPVALSANWAEAKLPVGEDISGNAPLGKKASTTLRLQVSNLTGDHRIFVRVNGHDLGGISQKGIGYETEVDPKFIVPGYNSIEVKTGQQTKAGASLDFLDLLVSYR